MFVLFREFRFPPIHSKLALASAGLAMLCGFTGTPAVRAQTYSLRAENPRTGGAPAAWEPIQHSRDADDVARYIAGLPGIPGSPFAELEADPAWAEHRRAVDAAWANAERERLAGLRLFQRTELNAPPLRDSPVFYPFGGPDALTATLYFPHSPDYVLVGLEPSGTLPSATEIKKKDQRTFLGSLRVSMASEIGHSFFVTREMDREFRGQVTDGLLVPVLHELVRTGHRILGFRYMRLDENGKVIGRAADYHVPGKIGNKGFEIEYQDEGGPASSTIHRLSYFTVNLSDEYLRQDKPFMTYVANHKGVVTLLKATSYMPHHADFSMIRTAVMEQSTAILQDDSGIPYRFFAAGGWDVRLFGEYTKPYGSFRWMEQSDLRKAFELGAKPLPVPVGYGYRRIPSNLLMAERAKLAGSATSVSRGQ